MEFNPITYWKNRKLGERGQGITIKNKRLEESLSPSTRKQSRAKLADPKHTKKYAVSKRKK